ncbi:putative coproporphyrinogen III oxidase, partial [Vibrio parahaemolyticus V-223/04]
FVTSFRMRPVANLSMSTLLP